MRKLLLTTAAFMVVSSPAFAQDWSGPYVAGLIGYATGDDSGSETLVFDTDQDGEFNDTVLTTAPANAFSPGFCDGTAQGTTPGAGCSADDDSGVDYGLRAGYDWQTGSVVYGIVGDVSRADISDSVTGFSTTPANYVMSREINYVVGLRGRLGFAMGRTLVYGTAGIAYGDLDRSFTTSNGANSFTERDNDGVWGPQYGIGAEWAFSDQMSVGAEALWTSLTDEDYTVRAGPGSAPPTNPFLLVDPTGTDIRRSNDRMDFGSLRFTASYRF
jgi:outer membrane immunogenic protein